MEIKPYSKNAKKHPKKQIQQIAASIKRFGFNQPIVVDKEGVIIVGHGRFEAALQLGMTMEEILKHVKVIDLTEEEAKAYRLADNKLNESEWEMDLVIEELKGLSTEMLDLTGFDKDLIIEPDERDDLVPEVPKEPQSKLGDLYELGPHRVLCGDSTQVEAVLRLMDGKKADMVFTDPPYGVNVGKKLGGRHILGDENVNAMTEIVKPAFVNISENIKSGAGYYICSPQGGDQELMMMMMMRDAGIKCRHQIIWKKDVAVFSMGRLDYDYIHEPILYGWKESHQFYAEKKKSVWEVARPKSSKLHPTMKPVELITEAIANSSKQEDIVLDLFLGSGSTLIASEKTGRVCYGMELDPKYVDVIVQRYVEYTGNSKIIKNGKEITWQKSE